MKAIFAVSALAAAISGQALAADTEATTTFNGAMKVDFTVDMAAETKNVNLDTTDDANDGGAYGLYMDVAVVNGPLSGTLTVKSEDSDTGSVSLGDIVVEDGAISFGQVGSLISTDDFAYDMADNAKSVDAAIRYNVMEGLDVQLEGTQTPTYGDDYGVAAAYSTTSGDLTVSADAQFRASDSGAAFADANNLDAQAFVYVGAGVSYASDMATVDAAVNNFSTGATNAGDRDTEFGVSVGLTPVDGLSVGAHVFDPSLTGENDMQYKVDASFGATDAITLSGHYESVVADGAVAEIMGKLAYSADMVAAYAGVTMNEGMAEHDAPLIEAGVSYTVESGIVYAADYTQGDDSGATDQNNIVFSAAYSF